MEEKEQIAAETQAATEPSESNEPAVEETPATTVESDDPDSPLTAEASEAASEAQPDDSPDASLPTEETAAAQPDIEQFLEPTAVVEQNAEESQLLAILEAIVYITDEPLSAEQIARALSRPLPETQRLLDKLVTEYNRPEHGLSVKEVAGGYKMATKPEHHEAVRTFVKNLNPPLKLSLAALETLAVIAYKQPITAPEIMEIRGVQGAGVLKTLLDRKLITTAGRKNVVGKPILYKTTKEFLVQFGLKDLAELPTLKEFEDLRRMAFSDVEEPAEPPAAEPEPEAEPQQQPE